MFTSFTCQSVSMQSTFDAHGVPAMIARHVQSGKDFTWNRHYGSNFPPPSHGDQIPHPLEDSDNQIPSSPGRKRCQMPGVCPEGGCWSFDLTDTLPCGRNLSVIGAHSQNLRKINFTMTKSDTRNLKCAVQQITSVRSKKWCMFEIWIKRIYISNLINCLIKKF